ncbi:hypothetical protein K1719_001868 [Acacia pycnantha]|nr:hypothetical protein K1719_001868 [Acacia pycnantha]
MAIRRENFYMPQEISINILKKLPVKSLIRFHAVCKDWKDLFKTPHFMAEYYHHSAHENPLLIFHAFGFSCNPRHLSSLCLLRYKMERFEVEGIPTDPLRCVRGIIGSSNGLLCVIGSRPSVLLLNPATREVRQVPRTTINGCIYDIVGWGFGYSPVVRDYKIVRIHTLESYFGEDHHPIIVSFDLAMEVFAMIPLPSSTSDAHTYATVLDVYKNELVLLHGCREHMYSFIDLWVLEEGSDAYGKSISWIKIYSIGPASYLFFPICIWRNEIVFQNIESEEDDSAFYLCDLTTNNELKSFHIFTSVHNMKGIFNYGESLASMHDLL